MAGALGLDDDTSLGGEYTEFSEGLLKGTFI
jgi:hypothetical protein